MRKRSKDISKEFEKLTQEKSDDLIQKIEIEILEECKKAIKESNKIFFEEKLKEYNLFKTNTNFKNKVSKSHMNLRTHSKKVKKRGRKPKNRKIENSGNVHHEESLNSPVRTNDRIGIVENSSKDKVY